MLKLATKFLPNAAGFEAAYRAGFRCAEFWLDERLLEHPEAIAALARQYPMEYALHCPNRLDLSNDGQSRMAELYQALGCRALVIHQPHADRFGAELLRQAPDLRLAVENHKLTPDAFTHWAEANPGLTLDVEHLWKYTLKDVPLPELLDAVKKFLERFGPKLRHVHLPGYTPGYAEHRPMYCSRSMIFGVFSLLSEMRFDGLIVSEASEEYQNPEELEMDVLLYRRWQAEKRAVE